MIKKPYNLLTCCLSLQYSYMEMTQQMPEYSYLFSLFFIKKRFPFWIHFAHHDHSLVYAAFIITGHMS